MLAMLRSRFVAAQTVRCSVVREHCWRRLSLLAGARPKETLSPGASARAGRAEPTRWQLAAAILSGLGAAGLFYNVASVHAKAPLELEETTTATPAMADGPPGAGAPAQGQGSRAPAPALLEHPFKSDKWGLHLPRAVEATLRNLAFREAAAVYVVHGAPGFGKTVACKAAVNGQKGVVWVSSAVDKSLLNVVGAALGVQHRGAAAREQIETGLRKAITYMRAMPGVPADWVPTVVVDIASSCSPAQLEGILWDLKTLATDLRLCAAFVVCNDAYAATCVHLLGGRVVPIAVESLHMNEVEYLTELARGAGVLQGRMATPELREDFARTVGTIPSTVYDAIAHAGNDLLKYHYSFVDRNAEYLWASEALPEFKPAVQALLTSLSRKYAKAVEASPTGVVRAEDVAVAPGDFGLTAVDLGKLLPSQRASGVISFNQERVSFGSMLAAGQIADWAGVKPAPGVDGVAKGGRARVAKQNKRPIAANVQAAR